MASTNRCLRVPTDAELATAEGWDVGLCDASEKARRKLAPQIRRAIARLAQAAVDGQPGRFPGDEVWTAAAKLRALCERWRDA